MTATEVTDSAERERLWSLADGVYPRYASYRQRASKRNRTIPIIRLSASQPIRSDKSGELLQPVAGHRRQLLGRSAFSPARTETSCGETTFIQGDPSVVSRDGRQRCFTDRILRPR